MANCITVVSFLIKICTVDSKGKIVLGESITKHNKCQIPLRATAHKFIRNCELPVHT